MKLKCICLAVLLTAAARNSFAQTHYFIDGYHGGVYGHYPVWYTRFMTDQLQANPHWKINLEIEPETWDYARIREPEAYREFKELFADQSDQGRIEYVNPAYGQSYLYMGSGESMIRQFSYGIQKVKEHFPEAVFTTYSSEEPCFTSAMPQVLRSFGFQYASLKNPNTCWGGYTRAYGGELVQWQGPDGSSILTVPRYATEALLPNSTWQTTAWNNGGEYIRTALAAGIKNPVGMCLQDAGWRNGPWLKQRAKYETWRNYIGNIADRQSATVWKVSQEDIQVSLVWGAQVLQQIAQQVRKAENAITIAEKYTALQALRYRSAWPQKALDTAWKSLLLAQHHDCWIVPYNGRKGDTWIDKVQRWTNNTIHQSDSLLGQYNTTGNYLRVINTTPYPRRQWVAVPHHKGGLLTVTGSNGKPVESILLADSTVIFLAQASPMGWSSYTFRESTGKIPMIQQDKYRLPNGRYRITSDLYQLEIDPARGGIITSLVTKGAATKEVVDQHHPRGFNELRGYFYEEGAWRSSTDTAATVRITAHNNRGVTAEISGFIAGHPFTQQIALVNGQRRIDMQVKIAWKGNPGIGAYSQAENYKAEMLQKAFYNDSFKLRVLFPVNMQQQQLSKDAPFDVTESRLDNTFFSRWDSIKNNVILHWADVTDGKNGLALFTDHTTSYSHGKDQPLGLTLQYSGRALWGRNYDIHTSTEVRYAIMPHAGNWANGGVSKEESQWTEPLQVVRSPAGGNFSLFSLPDAGWHITAMQQDGNDLLVRIYNAAGDSGEQAIIFSATASQVIMEQLSGAAIRTLPVKKTAGKTTVRLAMPRYGIRTIRLKNIVVNL